MRQLAIIITSLLIMINLSYADYHYASHSGSNTYPYTSWETAADTIQNAVNAASPYDTIYVGSGEYHQQVILNADQLSLIGMGWDSTLVWWDGQNEATIQIVSNTYYSYYFEGICIRQTEHYISLGNCCRVNIHVNRCRFFRCSTGINLCAVPDTAIIENCLFDSLGSTGIEQIFANGTNIIRNCLFYSVYSPIETSAGPAQKLLVANNIFFQSLVQFAVLASDDSDQVYNNLILNKSDGISIGYYIGSMGASPASINNTLNFNPLWPGSYWAIFEYGQSLSVSNNCISNREHGAFLDGPRYASRVTYNSIWNGSLFGGTPSGNIDSAGTLYAYPMFVNPDSGNYHLQAYSPLIDAGDPNIFDVDGTRSDIGAYGGPGGSFYEYRDLPPNVPDSLSGYLSGDTIFITWEMNHEADFNRYIINRDTTSGFTPWAGNIVAEPETSFFIDTNWGRSHNYYYKIAAYDNQWNLSRYSNELQVQVVGIEDGSGVEIPSMTAIESNYPNPFNLETTIIYKVANLGPMPAQINIDIFDILGRRVKSLLDERKEVGSYRIVWNGRDDAGSALTSGIYFARISQWNICFGTQKISLVK